jgi:hypothetical protein
MTNNPWPRTQFFGKRWDAPIVDDAEQVLTPVGLTCYDCGHAIEANDQGFLRPYVYAADEDGPLIAELRPIHRGCDMAGVAGHVFGVCSCTGWDDYYEAGKELVRRADAGLLKVGS